MRLEIKKSMNMKKVIVAVVAAVVSAVSVQAASAVPFFKKTSCERTVAPVRKLPALRADAAALWRPQKKELSLWNSGKWSNPMPVACTYNAQGYTLTETSPAVAVTYTYDERVPGMVVKTEIKENIGGQWVMTAGQHMEVTRNAAGNVTEVHYKTFSSGGWIEAGYYKVTYNASAKATNIEIYDMEAGYDAPAITLSGITWDRTDGQLLLDISLDGLESLAPFCTGANRVKSATVSTNAGMSATVSASYPDALGSFKATAKMLFITIASEVYTVHDAYGSYTDTIEMLDQDTGGMDKYVEKVAYDAWGLEKSKSETYNGDQVELLTAAIEYDQTMGYPLLYTTAETNAAGITENNERIAFSDYVNLASGITDIIAPQPDGPEVYYNLHGQPVTPNRPGLYITSRGRKVFLN